MPSTVIAAAAPPPSAEAASAPPDGRGGAWAAALLVVLVLAAALRFTGLAWDLRHHPQRDELLFVANVERMIEEGDLDHRFYGYPGLLFHLLRPVLALGRRLAPSVSPYLLARGVTALCGVLACALLYRLGRALAGRVVGLMAALLLAVSPLAVHTAHMVRADVVLQCASLLGLLAILRLGRRSSADVVAGLALGLGTSIKYTGALLAPSYLLARLLAPGPRARGIALAVLAAALVCVASSPAAFLRPAEFAAGMETQLGYHYDAAEKTSHSWLSGMGDWSRVWPRALGLPACALALLGLVLVLRSHPTTWLPLLLFPLVSHVVMASQPLLYWRQLLPSLGVPILLAAVGAQGLARPLARVPRARAAALAAGWAVVVAVPLAASWAYVREIASPSTRDRALDWVESHAAEGARVLTTVERIGLDEGRLEVLRRETLAAADGPQVLEMDLAVTRALDQAPPRLPVLARFVATGPYGGPEILIRGVAGPHRPPRRRLALAAGAVRASDNAADVPLLSDGRLDTLWRTSRPQREGDWLEVVLPEAATVARVELALGDGDRYAARNLSVLVSEDGGAWTARATLPGRPRPPGQHARPLSQVFVLAAPARARALRLELARPGAHRWGVAEVWIDAMP
ncbi:MAG TPA: glycosyltransferase family 39 protein [Vicinamibacteria bacterium]